MPNRFRGRRRSIQSEGRMINCMIVSVPRNPHATWITIGASRDDAEAHYRQSLKVGHFDKPVYRVVAQRKPVDPAVARFNQGRV
jgi:hypothetical protein